MPNEKNINQIKWRGMGRGRRGGFGLGPGGDCVCPDCGYSIPHQLWIPCNDSRCPHCDTIMERKEAIPEIVGKSKETHT